MFQKIVLLLCVSWSLSKASCNVFQKLVSQKECSKQFLIPQSEIESNGEDLSCNFFEKYIFRKNDCASNEIDVIKYYNKCNILERHLFKSEFCTYNPDEFLDVPQIIAKYGYMSETHSVVTDDGYILKLHRIPKPNGGPEPKQPVFLQHGILGSSADWIININNSLAFFLADNGYDVWLGNARGNSYSNGHILFPINSAAYWNFSFHEIGMKDLPAALYYIGNVTNKPGDIIYIGHSMGTTSFFVFASSNPQAAKHVKAMVGLAPVAYLTHIKSPLRYLAPFTSDLQWLRVNLGFNQFLPKNKLLKFLSFQCELLKIDEKICENLIFVICGFNKEEFNTDIFPIVLSKYPAGASTKTIVHYGQEVKKDGNFQQFDYGPEGNLIEYGTKFPPSYNLSNINLPVYLMYGMNDWLSNYTDVYRLGRELKQLQGLYRVPMDSFNHIDFIFGKDARKLVYNPLLKFISGYPTS